MQHVVSLLAQASEGKKLFLVYLCLSVAIMLLFLSLISLQSCTYQGLFLVLLCGGVFIVEPQVPEHGILTSDTAATPHNIGRKTIFA
jgi:membrane-bound ClpP family serine protease